MGLIALCLMAASAGPFAVAAVTETELATMRGGFRLPNGIDVALTVQTQTAVDGRVVLHTVFHADHGPPTVTVYVPRPGTVVAQPNETTTPGDAPSTMPSLRIDQRGVVDVLPGVVEPKTVSVTRGGSGGAIAVPAGMEIAGDAIQPQANGGLQTVKLETAELSVIHFAGRAFGSAIVNMGSDRMIESRTSVSIDLRNAGPDVLGSSMMRAQNLTFDALSLRGH